MSVCKWSFFTQNPFNVSQSCTNVKKSALAANLSTRDRDRARDHGTHAGAVKSARARAHCRSRGDDVVDEKYGPPGNFVRCVSAQAERILHVLTSLEVAEGRLRRREARAPEQIGAEGTPRDRGDSPCDKFTLVEPAFPHP